MRLESDRSIKVFFRRQTRSSPGHRRTRSLSYFLMLIPEELRIEPAVDAATRSTQIGGPTVTGLQKWARSTHRELLTQLDSVMPPKIEHLGGHPPPMPSRL